MTQIQIFFGDQEELVKESCECTNHLIIEDTYIDLIEFNERTEKYFYFLQENGYQSMNDLYTFPKNSLEISLCLDHFYGKQICNDFCKID